MAGVDPGALAAARQDVVAAPLPLEIEHGRTVAVLTVTVIAHAALTVA